MVTVTPTDTPNIYLLAQALACARGGRVLFNDLHFALSAGQLLWVRGPNGQGKSTLLRTLVGLTEPVAGYVQRTASLVYIGHQVALKGDLTVHEALSFLLGLQGCIADDAALLTALTTMGMHSKRHAMVRTLSQGQKRRVALARLLLPAPSQPDKPNSVVWILDEPYDTLDDQGTAMVDALIAQHRQTGGAVILTSHREVTSPQTTVLDLVAPASLPFATRAMA